MSLFLEAKCVKGFTLNPLLNLTPFWRKQFRPTPNPMGSLETGFGDSSIIHALIVGGVDELLNGSLVQTSRS